MTVNLNCGNIYMQQARRDKPIKFIFVTTCKGWKRPPNFSAQCKPGKTHWILSMTYPRQNSTKNTSIMSIFFK